ncbi:MAG: hypothetical protein EOM12_15230, partial [Verrucomicrobiae bacterium]|nr:hypothetical protein [Verrucomicrobiae bacterium]
MWWHIFLSTMCWHLTLSSLGENFVVEKRLMISLVRDNFSALGLSQYGVEINIDNLSKEEIVHYLESENFNSITYLKQDYFNFKKYIGSEHAPKHMDYLNNDCAPDLLRFMSVKMNGKKTSSYYNFLRGIQEADLPVFSDEQMPFINYLSSILPLVRQHEFMIYTCLINGVFDLSVIESELSDNIRNFRNEDFVHALKYMVESGFISIGSDEMKLNAQLDDQYVEYVQDLLSYGLTRYIVDHDDAEDFKLWGSYRIEQVQ